MFNTLLFFNDGGLEQPDQFVATVGVTNLDSENQLIYTSNDGISWVARALPTYEFQGNVKGISWSPTALTWVAGLQQRIRGWNGYNSLFSSPDGINWTLRQTPTLTEPINGYYLSPIAITWVSSLSLFVATGGDSRQYKVITSPDGITWTAAWGNGSDTVYTCIASDPVNQRIVAISNSGARAYADFSNLSSWTTSFFSPGLPAPAQYTAAINPGATSGIIVAVANEVYGMEAVYSTNGGRNWTSATSTIPENAAWEGLAYSPTLGSGQGRIVAVASTGTKRVMYSDNKGLTWSNTSVTGAGSVAWVAVTWSDKLSKFVAVGGSSSGTSSDGLTWTVTSGILPGSRIFKNVARGGKVI